MTAKKNPFEYSAATDLPPDMILDYYIEDFNYSRFLRSHRNVMLVGERGSGKSMALLYNSWSVCQLAAKRGKIQPPLDYIGVYVPCNTPLTHKAEYQLLGSMAAGILSEHFFALSITYAIADTLRQILGAVPDTSVSDLRNRLEFIFGADLPKDINLFEAIKVYIHREILASQRAINDRASQSVFYENTYSFSSLVLPILDMTRSLPSLRESHFMLLVDDAQDLNEYQLRALHSWIAYRDHSLFSFKVALANSSTTTRKTTTGGTILEGHDYTQIDMVQPYQNQQSDFGKLAKLLIEKRLERFGISRKANEFFPISEQLGQALAAAENAVRTEAEEKYGKNAGKQVADHIYKYVRAHYFRTRSSKANRPEYSGFDTLVFLSTGVIRNLLIPCYWMFDKLISNASSQGEKACKFDRIPPTVQSEIILQKSRDLWELLRTGLDQSIEECTIDDARCAYQLLDNLAIHFRARLLHHISEPRANSFTISATEQKYTKDLYRLFGILRQAQLLYIRTGPAKDKGRRELYYVPNRLLWPERGLDPHGQHARISLKAVDLWRAAFENKEIHFSEQTNNEQSAEEKNNNEQPQLFR